MRERRGINAGAHLIMVESAAVMRQLSMKVLHFKSTVRGGVAAIIYRTDGSKLILIKLALLSLCTMLSAEKVFVK